LTSTGNANKTALIEAAKQLVGERGYAGTSVRDLVAASGTNLAAVNYHFGSRDQLLTQAVLESFLEWTDRLGRAARADPKAGPVEQILASVHAMLGDFAETEAMFASFLEAVLQARRSPELRGQLAEHYAEQRRRVGELVVGGQGDRQVPARMVEVIASLLIAVTDGLLLQSVLDPGAVPTGDELTLLAGGVTAAVMSSRDRATQSEES
jgi:AcrR family transcriptional regulator